jgi:hypothetical protein
VGASVLAGAAGQPPDVMLQALLDAVRAFSGGATQHEDLTAMDRAVRRPGLVSEKFGSGFGLLALGLALVWACRHAHATQRSPFHSLEIIGWNQGRGTVRTGVAYARVLTRTMTQRACWITSRMPFVAGVGSHGHRRSRMVATRCCARSSAAGTSLTRT